jgi:hypothetical protein
VQKAWTTNMTAASTAAAAIADAAPPPDWPAVSVSSAWTLRNLLHTPTGRTVLLIVFTLLARLVFAEALGLGIDESYMVAAGRTIRLGYFDHPPMAWWMAWGASHLFGSESPIVVRLPFVLLFAGTTWLMFRLTATMFGAAAGFWAAAMLNAAPVFGMTTGAWVLPDGPMMAALLGAAVCLAAALPAQGRAAWGWWIGTGVCAGLAMFSKYTAALSILGAVIYLLTNAAGRRWLTRPHPYVAALAALAVFSPVLAWNAGNGWASLLFQAGRAGVGRLQPFGPLTTLAGEALFLLPWIWLPLAACAVIAARRGPADPRRWLLFCLALPPILTFEFVSLHSRVLFHWAGGGYLLLFPLLGEAIDRRWRTSRLLRLYPIVTGVIVLIAAGLVSSEVRFNWLPGLVKDFGLGKDPDLDAVDWTSVRTDFVARGLLDRPGLVVAGLRWHEAGKIDYALGGLATVICLGNDPREYGISANVRNFIGRDVLIVAPRRTQAEIMAKLGESFDSIDALPPTLVRHAGRPALAIPLFLGHRMHDPAETGQGAKTGS